MSLVGSLGSYILKLDKTAGIGIKTIKLRSKTRGWVTADQEIEYVICPNLGGSKVTPPTPHPTSVVDGTGGIEITLENLSLYQRVNQGATGSDANANFAAWSIQDIYPGCGVFKKYAITGSAGDLAKLQYPEPGKTLSVDCTRITDCLAVRVISTSSPSVIRFTLQLYPEYGADPISVPYVVDVTPCDQATFTVPNGPTPWIISRTLDNTSTVTKSVATAYSSLFVTSNALCPITDYQLNDINLAPWTDPKIVMTNPGVPANTNLVVKHSSSFSFTVKIKAYTMVKNTFMNLDVRVCGAETLSLASADRQFFIYGQNTADPLTLTDA